jgi:GTP-binding protein YchF
LIRMIRQSFLRKVRKTFCDFQANKSFSTSAHGIGLVGMPNVGKSTLFNALTETQSAEAANFPFCTIEPNSAQVSIRDHRAVKLAKLSCSERILPAQVDFTDIAGLIKGASEGQGLGNKFLSNIRECAVVAQVIRCFEDEGVIHVEDDGPDAVRDINTIETELVLADLQSVEARVQRLAGRRGKATPVDALLLDTLQRVLPVLEEGLPARIALGALAVQAAEQMAAGASKAAATELAVWRTLHLLTAKPTLYICNVDEDGASDVQGNAMFRSVVAHVEATAVEHAVAAAKLPGASSTSTSGLTLRPAVLKVCARMEEEIGAAVSACASVEEADATRAEFLESFGLAETGLDAVIREGSALLGLRTFFTTGPMETRAWRVRAGARAPAAAGQIHTDIERGFIRADTLSWDEYLHLGGWEKARAAGKVRSEGKEYEVQDGDVMLFRHNK